MILIEKKSLKCFTKSVAKKKNNNNNKKNKKELTAEKVKSSYSYSQWTINYSYSQIKNRS